MTHLTKVLDTLTGICVVLLFSKYFVTYANMVFARKHTTFANYIIYSDVYFRSIF